VETDNLASEIKLATIQHELLEWKQLLYTMKTRYWVNKRIGVLLEALAAVEQECPCAEGGYRGSIVIP